MVRAIEMYQSALKENPSYNLVYQGLAECFYALDEYDQALSFVESARKYKKDDPDLQNLHGFILVGLGKIDAAKTLFNGVLKKYPNNPEARFGLAEIEVSKESSILLPRCISKTFSVRAKTERIFFL